MTCPREGRLIGGCKFEARYDAVFPKRVDTIYEGASSSKIEALKDRVYIRDVCTRCGKTIERNG